MEIEFLVQFVNSWQKKLSLLACLHHNLMLSAAGSVSELSSLHDGDVEFRQTYRQVQKKALPSISDPSNESQTHTASTTHRLRPTRYLSSHAEEQHDNRYNFCACAWYFCCSFDNPGAVYANSCVYLYVGGTAVQSTCPGKPLTPGVAQGLWMNWRSLRGTMGIELGGGVTFMIFVTLNKILTWNWAARISIGHVVSGMMMPTGSAVAPHKGEITPAAKGMLLVESHTMTSTWPLCWSTRQGGRVNVVAGLMRTVTHRQRAPRRAVTVTTADRQATDQRRMSPCLHIVRLIAAGLRDLWNKSTVGPWNQP